MSKLPTCCWVVGSVISTLLVTVDGVLAEYPFPVESTLKVALKSVELMLLVMLGFSANLSLVNSTLRSPSVLTCCICTRVGLPLEFPV
jgi:hypothetical protein